MNMPQAEQATLLTRLDHLGLIEVRGADAETFLQGQLSNDVRDLSVTRAQLSSFNSPKGRMLAVLHLFRGADSPAGAASPAVFLEVHRSVLDSTLKRLRMFVLRSKVLLEDVSSRWSILGIAGADAGSRLTARGLPAPAAPMDLIWADNLAILRRHGDIPRFTLTGPAEQITELSAALNGGSDVTSWKRLEIEAGIPTVYPETSDHFVPQMCNLDTLGGISFNKGCYTGQEIVARVHYRGAVKRRMVKIRLPSEPPPPGLKIEQGEVVDAAPHPEGGSIALIVARED